jgi:predicted nucleic acid-binding protein
VPVYVSNSSPLIVFQRIGRLELLAALLKRVYIPAAVRREVFSADLLPDWIEERQPAQPLAAQVLAAQLGPGEGEAIALALEANATWVLIDDRPARRLARSLGLTVVGSAGLLVKAKDQGLISEVRTLLEAMRDHDFRISDKVVKAILSAANEGGPEA